MILKSLLGAPLKPGTKAPEFVLQDQGGKTHKLTDYKGRWVVLFFYPRDGSPMCTKEACSFRDESEFFKGAGAVVLGISADDVKSHEKFAADHALSYPLLSDFTKNVSRDYGVLAAGGLVVSRVTFIVDPTGVIAEKFEWVNWFNYGKTVGAKLTELQSRFP